MAGPLNTNAKDLATWPALLFEAGKFWVGVKNQREIDEAENREARQAAGLT